jgi:hypothetical protein
MRQNTVQRSHHGCARCKRRRQKCDELRPGCGRCMEAGSECSYAKTLKWLVAPRSVGKKKKELNTGKQCCGGITQYGPIHKCSLTALLSPEDSKAIVPIAPLSCSSATESGPLTCLNTPRQGYGVPPIETTLSKEIDALSWLPLSSRSLLHHFVNKASHITACHAHIQTRICRLIVPMALQTPSLLYATMALSALHRSTLIDGMPMNFDLDELVSSFMASSLQNLRHELQAKEGISKYALLATIRTLCVCEIHSGRADARSWRVHVEGAIALLGTTRAISGTSPVDDGESQWLIGSWYASIESLMALTTRRGLPGPQTEQLGPRVLLRETQAENRYLDIYSAYSTDLNDTFKRIRAAAWERQQLNANADITIEPSNRDLDEEADRLESSIRAMIGNSTFRPNDLQVLSQHEAQQFHACNETYYHTALIHVLRRVRQLPRSDLRVQASVKRIIECCLQITPADGLSPWVMLTTPLFTAGCEALGEDRAMVRQLLQSMYDSLRIRNIQRSLGILETSWSNTEDNDDWDSLLGEKSVHGSLPQLYMISNSM